MKAIVYLPIKPEVAKANNLPLKLPVLAEDLPLIAEKDHIPLDVIIRGLEAEVSLNKDGKEYYQTYLQYFYYEKFKKLLNEGKLQEAEECLEKGKSLGEDYRYHFYKGLLLREMGREGEAEVELKVASSMNPHFSLAHYELGRMYMRRGEYEDAEEEFKKALKKDPDFPLPLVKLGDVYLSKGEIQKALESYQKALEKKEDLPDVYNRLGVIYNSLQDFKTARSMFEKALKIWPDYADAQFNLAYTLSKLGRQFEALEILQNLEKRAPEDPAVLNELGVLMRELGLFEDSVEKLERAIEISEDEGTKLNLARSLMFVDRSKAKEILKQLEEGEFAEEARRYLEYMERKNELSFGPFSELVEVISECEDLVCVLEGIELEGELGKRIEKILEGFVMGGSELDTPKLLDLATAYIMAGEDFVEMERRAIEFSTAVYGSGRMMGIVRTLLRLLQMKSSEGFVEVQSFLDSVVPEIQDLDWGLALKISKSLHTIPSENPKSGTEFITSLLFYLNEEEIPDHYKPWIEILR